MTTLHAQVDPTTPRERNYAIDEHAAYTTAHPRYVPARRISFPKAFGLGVCVAGTGVALACGLSGLMEPNYPEAREWFRVATVAVTIATLGGVLFLAEFLREAPLTVEEELRPVTWPCASCGTYKPLAELKRNDGLLCDECNNLEAA